MHLGRGASRPVNPSVRPWPTSTYFQRRHWGSAVDPKIGWPSISLPATGGVCPLRRIEERTAKWIARQSDQWTPGDKHSITLWGPHRWAAAKCRRLLRTQRSLWASRQMKTKDANDGACAGGGQRVEQGDQFRLFSKRHMKTVRLWWRPATEGSERVVGSSHQSLGRVWYYRCRR